MIGKEEVSLLVDLIIHRENPKEGSLGGAAVQRLPLAQGGILETRDRIPHRAPRCMEPASLSAYVSASLSLSL